MHRFIHTIEVIKMSNNEEKFEEDFEEDFEENLDGLFEELEEYFNFILYHRTRLMVLFR